MITIQLVATEPDTALRSDENERPFDKMAVAYEKGGGFHNHPISLAPLKARVTNAKAFQPCCYP